MRIASSGIWYLLVSVAIIAIDYFSKSWIMQHIEAYSWNDVINVIPGFFRIVHVHNTGAAFSFLAEYPGWQQWIFGGLAVLISGYLAFMLGKNPFGRTWHNLAGALIIGGALGNLIDRVSYGFVVDFLDFFITSNGIEKHYPAFNVADIAICVGVGLLILVELAACVKMFLKMVLNREGGV